MVFGGYGTFGAQVCRELARMGVEVTVAGRDGRRAEAFARSLGPAHHGVEADAADEASCRRTLEGQSVAVCCAGPFSTLGEALIEACLRAGCHYADIAEDRAYAGCVRRAGERFRKRGLRAVYGCSSLPGISGALALAARRELPDRPERARVTLFIGNDNPRGEAATRAAAAMIGRPIAAPQGMLRGFRGRETVPLPPPFGPRPAHDIESPEYDLFPALLGVGSVSVKVGFEWGPAAAVFAALGRLPLPLGSRAGGWLSRLAPWVPRKGSSGGAVLVELFGAKHVSRTALVAPGEGQRMAALPCALAAAALLGGAPAGALRVEGGALTAYELLGAGPLLEALVAGGFTLVKEQGTASGGHAALG